VSGSRDKTLRVWDLETGACLRILKGHGGEVVSVSVTPDGQQAASASADKTLRLWDLETGACMAVMHGNAHWSVAEAGAASRLVAATSTGTVAVFDFRGLTRRPDQWDEDAEQQLRREVTACSANLGSSHPNTLLGKLALAALLEGSGNKLGAAILYAEVSQACLALTDARDTAVREVVERLIHNLESAGETSHVGSLRAKLWSADGIMYRGEFEAEGFVRLLPPPLTD
jgi:hypothetical protein